MNKRTNKPIKILDFRGTYKGGGGPDKTILLSAAMHDRQIVDVLVAYLRDPRDNEFQISQKAAALKIPYLEFADRHMIDAKCLKRLDTVIKTRAIAMLHAHDDKTLLYGYILKLFNPKLIIVYTCHLLLEYVREDFDRCLDYWNHLARKQVSLLLTKQYAKPVMAVSHATKSQLNRYSMSNRDVIVLHNGIQEDKWVRQNGNVQLRQELNLSEDTVVIGTVARLDQQKDFPTFFKVVQSIKKRKDKVKFIIVGDGKGDELSALKQQAVDMEVDKDIIFTGHRNDLLEVYSSFDLFLMTSVMEGLPNTVLEAMSMELPVISTSVAGVPELVADGATGYLCPVGNVQALTDRVLTLVENEPLRKQFAQAGRQRIKDEFGFRNRVKKLEDLYCNYALC